jgi:hypothetical protein
MLPAAAQAAFDPRGFFDGFPLGRGWVGHGLDTYDEHLVRDVGGLLLGMIVITVWVVARDAPTRGVALGWLVQGTLHLVHHSRHLDGWAASDAIGLIGSLVIVPVLALTALLAAPRRRHRHADEQVSQTARRAAVFGERRIARDRVRSPAGPIRRLVDEGE